MLFRQTFTGTLTMHTYATSELEKDWLQKHIHLWVRKLFMSGGLKFAGVALLPEEVPRDMVDTAIPKPWTDTAGNHKDVECR